MVTVIESKENQSQDILVSAIVSTYNAERFIRDRLQNLIDQTLYKNQQLEIIVVDSNSLQNERAIVEEFMTSREGILYLRTSERESVYGAWNRGIKLASGSYVINANTDDRFAEDALERMASELDSDPGIHAVYGDWMATRVENDTFDSDTDKFVFHYPEFSPPLFFYYQVTSHAPLLRKDVFQQIGFYDERLRVFGDRDFMFRFSASGLKAKKIPHIVGLYLENPTSLERSEESAEREFASIREQYAAPEHFVRLFGCESIPGKTQLAELYALVGSLGKEFYLWNDRPISDFPFAAQFFAKALKLDPENIVALNNLGIIFCLHKQHQQAAQLFGQALQLDLGRGRTEVQANLSAARRGSAGLEEYLWLEPKALNRQLLTPDLTTTQFIREQAQSTDPLTSRPKQSVPTQNPKTRNPLVSVIIPTYNRPETLREALVSLADQTFCDFEVIVVNDGGADVEPELADFRDRLTVRYIQHPTNRERSVARNSGLHVAQGKYIAYLDDDDIFYPDHLETLVEFLENNDYKVAYTDAYRAHQEKENGKYVVRTRNLTYSLDFDQDLILVHNFIPTLCVMHEKACLDEVGLFDETLGTHEDWDLWIRMSRRFKFAHIKKVTAEFAWRTDGTTTTSGKPADFLRTMEVIYEKYKHYTRNKPHLIKAQRRRLQNRENAIYGQDIPLAPSAETEIISLMEAARDALDRQDWESAETVLRTCIERFPAFLEAYLILSDLLTMQGNLKAARDVLEAARETDPDAPALLHRVGVNRYARGDLISAEKALQQAHTQASEDPDILVSLGRLYFDLKRYEEALASLQIAIRLNPSDVEPWVGAALVAQRLDDQETFEVAYRRARELDPTHPKLSELAPEPLQEER